MRKTDLKRLLTSCVLLMMLSGCFSYGIQKSPTYPFTFTIYEDGSCVGEVFVNKRKFALNGSDFNARIQPCDSFDGNHFSYECLLGYNETYNDYSGNMRFRLYSDLTYTPDMIIEWEREGSMPLHRNTAAFLRTDQDLTFKLSPHAEGESINGYDRYVNSELGMNYTSGIRHESSCEQHYST